MLHCKTKHIEVRYHFLRDSVEKGKIALIHVPTHDQLADIFTKPLDQSTFTCSRGELCVCWISWVGCVGAPLLHMYSFSLCISCIWHRICNMMYRHPCILDCMHFVPYALVRKSFSYMHCSPRNAIYVFVSLFGMMRLVWLSSWKSWFISMVDGYVFEKYHMYALLWVNAFIWSWHVLVVWLCLICGWIAYFDHMWPKSLRIQKWNVKFLGNVLPCHMCWI
jgi:hypothetical protein